MGLKLETSFKSEQQIALEIPNNFFKKRISLETDVKHLLITLIPKYYVFLFIRKSSNVSEFNITAKTTTENNVLKIETNAIIITFLYLPGTY